jgi:cobalt-zinc-cadmium resistance protein CzcA
VSVQTGVIMLEYIDQLRAKGFTVVDAAVEGAVLRLRPIMLTMLVATFGLLPARFHTKLDPIRSGRLPLRSLAVSSQTCA